MKEEFLYVVENSKYVHINEEKIEDFIKDLGEIKYTHWAKKLDYSLTEKEWILLCFIIESMNFCFWKTPKWVIEYHNERYSGSNALFNAILKEVENNKKFLNLEYLEQLSLNDFKKIVKGIEGECPHLEKRYENMKEVINYINENPFYEELYEITSDRELLEYITKNFKSFDDKSTYKGKIIHFNKRATLLTNDLYYVSETIRKNIKNVNDLSGCADYGIPRTFRDYNILIYEEELKEKIDNEIEIEHDSEMEIELRANMLYIIEIIKEKLKEKNIIINSVELDNLIWWMGKKMENRSKSHHTVTIFY